MATKLGKIVADFTSQLATKISVGGTTATLQSATDDDGNALASGRYFFTIDGDNTRKEHISADLSGTALTNIKSISRAGVESTGVAREHRVGATISITDFAHIKYLNDLLDGTTNLNASTPLEYDGTATINADNQLATKDYVDNVAIAGAPDSTTTTKGLVEKATTAEIDAGTATGGDGPLSVSPDQLAASIYNTQLPSSDQKAALVGTSGTPSTSNKFITADDVSDAAAPGKIVRATGTALPALDGQNLTGVAKSQDNFTADGDISDKDAVYPTANDTVKKFVINSLNSTTSVSTSATDHLSPLVIRLDNGKLLHIGCPRSGGQYLYAFVRTLNAAETDFANGSSYTIHDGGASGSSRSVDVAKIGTDKYLVIYQKSSSGPTAAGIDAKVISVSGTTVTGGSAVTLEGTGDLSLSVRAVRIEDDKCLVTYYEQSTGRLKAEVLTISGTTITSNTAINVRDASLSVGIKNYGLTLIDTNKALCVFTQYSTGDMYGVTLTVSGSSVTASSGDVLVNGSNNTNYNVTLEQITTDKALMMYHQEGASVAAYSSILTVSGDTVSKGSDLTLDTYNVGEDKRDAMKVIGTTRAIVSHYIGVDTINYRLLDISGATPVSLVDNDITVATISGVSERGQVTIGKVKPALYYIAASGTTGDSLLLFDWPTDKHIGIALASISDAASGAVGYRFIKQTGFTGLTAGSRYYIDDDGQPTTDGSLNAIPYGYALNATTMLLE